MHNYMKAVIYILAISILTLSCNNNNENVKTITSISDSLKTINYQEKKDKRVIDLIYESENIRITGDTTIDKEKILYASLKFEPYISFDDFKIINIDNKSKAKLDLSSNKNARNFRTRLKEAYETDTSNFAGHYTFVSWGCGSPCQSSLLIDRQTGKIYDSPEASLGYDYRTDSRMLLTNLPDSSGFYDDCIYCKPIIFLFDEKTKTFTEKKSKK
jgi:hypothetical protein